MAPVPGGRRSGRRRRRRRCRPTGPGTWSGPCAGRRPGGPGGAGWRRKGRGPWLGRGGGASIGFFFFRRSGVVSMPLSKQKAVAPCSDGARPAAPGDADTRKRCGVRCLCVRVCVRELRARAPQHRPLGAWRKRKMERASQEGSRHSLRICSTLAHTHIPPRPAPPRASSLPPLSLRPKHNHGRLPERARHGVSCLACVRGRARPKRWSAGRAGPPRCALFPATRQDPPRPARHPHTPRPLVFLFAAATTITTPSSSSSSSSGSSNSSGNASSRPSWPGRPPRRRPRPPSQGSRPRRPRTSRSRSRPGWRKR